MKCLLCNLVYPGEGVEIVSKQYDCPRCGQVHLTTECYENFLTANFSDQDKAVISIWLREEHEKRQGKPIEKGLTLNDLQRIAKETPELDPLKKMDRALLNLDKATKFVGDQVSVDLERDYYYYHSMSSAELTHMLRYLVEDGLMESHSPEESIRYLSITPKGYDRLARIKRPLTESPIQKIGGAMRVVLFVLAAAAAVMGVLALVYAKTSMHQIGAYVLLLICSILVVGVAIVQAVYVSGKKSNELLEKLIVRLSGRR